MSSVADKIRIAQDKDGMLRRALERIIQLYTDKSHFVYELLQNAEDAEATSIKFVQYDDRLEVLHDGKPFTAANLQGLCDIGKSDKVDNLNQIGEFGVGFKSVFGICDTVLLYSSPDHFRNLAATDIGSFAVEILDFTRPEDIEYNPIESSYTTKFVFPYVVGKSFSGFNSVAELNRVLSQKLQNLGITTLLFMKNLELIEYQIKTCNLETDGQYLLEKQIINDHCALVSALGVSGIDSKSESDDEVISYLKFSRQIGKDSSRTVDIAFPVLVDKNGNYKCLKPKNPYVSVYFPTETESKLDFIVQGPYRTTPNRSSIPADDHDNIRLAKETAILLIESILELKATGKFNMSFVKSLPLKAKNFDVFNLFYPLHEAVYNLFATHAIIPCGDGGYVAAKYAKIARQEKLAVLLPDKLLTSLINDGHTYHWLPTFLTENNREYEHVYRFLNIDLKISVIRPEDLRTFFVSNPGFLPKRDDPWLIELYSILENVGTAFSKAKNETNMLTADIVKTSDGRFVAPYRKTDSKQYIHNVFIPSSKITSSDINFVDSYLYEQCRHFFDDVLQLQKPNEYEFFVQDFKKRYNGPYKFSEEKHIEDLKYLLRYYKHEEYQDEIVRLIKDNLVLKCKDGRMRSPYSSRIFLPLSPDGINIEGYYRNVVKTVSFVDIEFYTLHDITPEALCIFGVCNSILTGENVTQGTYDTGGRVRQPEWWTPGDFRWKLSLDSVKDVLMYISNHSTAPDSMLKSQAILKMVLANESRLVGSVRISGSTQNLEDETCELIKVLNGERNLAWNRKWLFTESGELVSQKSISKHDINTSIYGRINTDSKIFELLGFRKTEDDEVDELRKTVPKKQLDAYFETELKKRFGITSIDLTKKYGDFNPNSEDDNSEPVLPFPIAKVKNWETLKKHAAEMLIYADPVKYEYAVRSVRVSNHDREARAYLHNMYRYEGAYKYACQLCHESCATIERAQIFNNPDTELDPMNLCLCPNCASTYRRLRNNSREMEALKKHILDIDETDVSNGEQVILPVGSKELWFTQTHFAEVQSLMKLTEEVKSGKSEPEQNSPTTTDDKNEKAGLSVYNSYIGKQIIRKSDGFLGTIVAVDSKFVTVNVIKGEKAGQSTKIQLSFVLQRNGVYEIK